MRRKYAPMQHAATTLNPLEGFERDSMSLKICSLANRNDQIDYKCSITTHSIISQCLMKCRNKSNSSNSKYFAGVIHRHLKWVILQGVLREQSIRVTTTISTQQSTEESWIVGQSKLKCCASLRALSTRIIETMTSSADKYISVE